MTAAKADVIVFLTHIFDAEVERRFFKLKQECSDICDVVLLVEHGVTVPETVAAFTLSFDYGRLKQLAKSVIGTKIIPGNCHLRSIDFYRRSPNYRFYWFVEYDVVYTGHWGKFVESFGEDPSDLLASHVRTLADEPDWSWQESFSTATDPLPKQAWVIAFLPIHRISSRGLEALARKVRDGWVGHFEVLLPSALAWCGLLVADIGGSGAWTPKHRILRHYVDWRYGLHYLYGVGTLRFRPTIRSRLTKNKLYHPCKTSPSDDRPPLQLRNVRAQLRTPSIFVRYWLRTFWLAVLSRRPR